MTLKALFISKDDNGFVTAMPQITLNGKKKSVEKLITKAAEAVEPAIHNLWTKDVGNLTLGAYILLEVLQRTGYKERADDLLNDPITLMMESFFLMIGLEVGKRLPKGIKIETIFEEVPTDLRELQ